MSFLVKPPTIPNSSNLDNLNVNKELKTSNLMHNGEFLGFFGKKTTQLDVSENLSSIVRLLREYGLSSEGIDSNKNWVQYGQKLIGLNNNSGNTLQGKSVSLSSDGNTLAIGGFSDDSNIGATWIFVKLSGVWTQQGSKLIGTGGISSQSQGQSVSLSSDGNTLAIGGSSDNTSIGATWIFTRTNGIWTQQGSKLIGTGGVNIQSQGYSISLSSNGNTLAIGGVSDDSNIGATWIFTRTNGIWTQQGSKLVGTGGVGVQSQGQSVSLSSDGNTLAIGGFSDDSNIGATWIFTRTNGIWTQQGSKLVGIGGVGVQYQGQSVSLSSDGNTLAIGGGIDDNNIGATWIFIRTNGIWTQQGSKLVGTGGVGVQSQGYSISLSSDGNTLAVGGNDDYNSVGATWIFTRTDGIWTQQGSKLVGNGVNNVQRASYQGISVSLSSDGNTLAIGGYYDYNYNIITGATWIFNYS
jgi:hypothetical protein